jgi:uncharacterized protein YqhQ
MTEKSKMPTYGGQAVIEGVMMRGSRAVAIAMRAPNKEIVVHTEPLGGIYQSRLAKIPFLRGLIMLWDALGLGMRALTLSANTQSGEDEKLEGPAMYLTLFISLAFGIGLFFLAPAAVGQLSESFLKWNSWLRQFGCEGIVRLLLLIGYIWLIGQWGEIACVSLNVAEHGTINAFEAGVDLTPENVSKFSLEHHRGTAFLLTLVVMSVLLFSLLGPLPAFWRFASRILFLPILAGLAYEFIRWTANHLENPFVRLLIKPSLSLQHLTTREPSLDMLEVAITAFKTMRTEEERLIT